MDELVGGIGWETTYWPVEGDSMVAATKGIMRETPWPIFVNEQEWVTVVTTPVQLELFAVGFLYNEGVISSLDDVLSVRVCEEPEAIIDVRLSHPVALPEKRTLTSGCGGGTTFADLAAARDVLDVTKSWATDDVYAGMSAMLAAVAEAYRAVGGFHSSALSPGGGRIRLIGNDVGRHNTFDKLAGACLLQGIEARDHMLITTGRISSEMIGKAARLGVEVLVSRNSPTAMAVQLARAWNVTVIGYCRGRRMHIYSAPERIRVAASAPVGELTTPRPASMPLASRVAEGRNKVS